jgi:hypothetical protein
VASRLIRDVGYEPVLTGGLEMGKHLIRGTSFADERSAEEIRKIAAGLNWGADHLTRRKSVIEIQF